MKDFKIGEWAYDDTLEYAFVILAIREYAEDADEGEAWYDGYEDIYCCPHRFENCIIPTKEQVEDACRDMIKDFDPFKEAVNYGK